MARFVTISNLIFASLAVFLAASSAISAAGELELLGCLICVGWAVCAVQLLRSQHLWPWIGSLISVAMAFLGFGQGLLWVLTDVWRYQYGDRTVHIDPSTTGAAMIAFGLHTAGALLLLLGLCMLPKLRASDAKIQT